MFKNIAIIGSSGAIGSAMTKQLSVLHQDAIIQSINGVRLD